MEDVCFDVGLRICGDDGFAHYVDDVDGVSYNLVASLREEQCQTVSEKFNKIKQATYSQFLTEVELKLSKKKNFNHIVAESKPFSASRNRALYLPNGNLDGYWIRLPYHRFTSYNLHNIAFNVHKAGKVEIRIIDLVTQKLEYSTILDLAKGINVHKLDISFKNDFQSELFVCIHNIDAVLYEMKCEELEDTCNCTCMRHCGCDDEDCYFDYGSMAFCDVYEYSSLSKNNVKLFCLDSSINCDFSRMICAYREYFVYSFKLKLAINVLYSKLNSYDRSWFSEANSTIVKDMTLPMLEERYDDSLRLSIQNINGITNDSICFECGSKSGVPVLSSFV